MENYFDAPPEGAIPTQTSKMQMRAVQWRPHKTPKDFAASAGGDLFQSWVNDGKVGFTTYDKEEKRTFTMSRFSFVVLDMVAGCDGTVWGADNRPVDRYYSNRVFDTRTQRLAVWREGQSGQPAFSGLYRDIKAQLPQGVGYSKYIVAYCIELDCMVELEVRVQVENAIKKCLAAIDNEKGKRTKPEQVNNYNIAANDHLWGFSFAGYEKVDKDGNEYKGQGDLFFAPKFKAGILNPNKPEAAELHGKCAALQTEYREYLREKINRAAKYNEPAQEPAQAQQEQAKGAFTQAVQNDVLFAGPKQKARQEPDTFHWPTAEPPVIVEQADDLPF